MIRNLSERHKFTAIAVLTTMIVVFLASSVFVALEFNNYQRALVQELTAIAQITSSNSTAAILFGDPSADHYSASPQPWNGVLRAPEYGADCAVRRVRHNGEIRWRGATVYINQALAGEPVGLSETDDGGWAVCYGAIELGVIDHRGDRLQRQKRSARGFAVNPDGLPTTPPVQQLPQADQSP